MGGLEEIREHSFPDETCQIGIDFDGVIHKNSKGFYDGTIYDQPVNGALAALKYLSQHYEVIIYSAKARKDRMLINGKTGVQLIWEWLNKHNMSEYIAEVTSEKPRAVAYVDDKAFRFVEWKTTLNALKNTGVLK